MAAFDCCSLNSNMIRSHGWWTNHLVCQISFSGFLRVWEKNLPSCTPYKCYSQTQGHLLVWYSPAVCLCSSQMVSCSLGAWTPVVSWAWGKESQVNFSLSPWSLWQESPWRKSLLVGTTALPSPCLEQCLVGARTERGNWVSMINKVINEARKVTKVKVVFFYHRSEIHF